MQLKKKKKQLDATEHLSGTLITPNTSKDLEQENTHLLLVELQDGSATLEGCLAVFYSAKHKIQHLFSTIFTKK